MSIKFDKRPKGEITWVDHTQKEFYRHGNVINLSVSETTYAGTEAKCFSITYSIRDSRRETWVPDNPTNKPVNVNLQLEPKVARALGIMLMRTAMSEDDERVPHTWLAFDNGAATNPVKLDLPLEFE